PPTRDERRLPGRGRGGVGGRGHRRGGRRRCRRRRRRCRRYRRLQRRRVLVGLRRGRNHGRATPTAAATTATATIGRRARGRCGGRSTTPAGRAATAAARRR